MKGDILAPDGASSVPTDVDLQPGTRIAVMAAKLRVPASESYGLVRLDALMNRFWGRRLGLVVAPAGSGKTTLLSRFASTARAPVAWYRSESWDASQNHLLRHLEEAFVGIIGPHSRPWASVEDAIAALDGWSGERLLLVIDDLHSIARTPAEAALERFIDYAPPSLLTVIASRSQPAFNLSRLRVSGTLAEITGDDLRFRSWEVENLFRDFYREPLPPVELAELARRTEGWAAGLQLFHLATSGKGLDERRRVLRALGGGSRLVREYLARNVLDELPPLLRDFLIDTCVLGRLSGLICDEFLNRDDSGQVLQELERRQIFTTAIGSDGDYRYHEVLRSHLEHVLVIEGGERALRARYGSAGAVLEQHGAIPEALHAYCRAEDWSAVDRLLGRNGAQLASRTGIWIDALPPAILEHDPWLLLASARRHRAEGRWHNALEAYQRAEHGFSGLEATQICQRERSALALWLTPTPAPAVDSLGLFRLATIRDPLAVRAQLAAQTAGQERLVAGVASLLAGEVLEATRLFSLAAESPDNSDAVVVAARLGSALASLLAGAAGAVGELDLAVEDADARGQGFIARLGRAGMALVSDQRGLAEADAVRSVCEHIGDEWGSAFAALLRGWCLVQTGGQGGDAVSDLEVVGDTFHQLGAGVLEAWSRALLALALAQQRHPGALGAALKAESLANSIGVEGAKLFIYLALARSDARHTMEFVQLARSVVARTGLSAHLLDAHLSPSAQSPDHALTIRCFGEFRILIDGQPLAMARMKPRTRALLRRLSADAGSPIHREVLQDALWPDADADAAARNLHVAISSLRQALEPGIARGASSLLVREGDSYRLVLPPGSEVDLRAFDQALDRSRRARLAGDFELALVTFQEAESMAEKELLPEDGSADWVIQRRDRMRTGLVDTGGALAKHLLAKAEPALAAQVSVSALNADRYDDALWRLLIEARKMAGDEAGARRAQSEYRKVVSELEPRPTRS